MKKLLIVDDEIKIREMIKKYATFEGYEVEEANDGMAAIVSCDDNTYDLIIMDVMMPELDGFSASRIIRKKSNVPIIILSARSEEYDKIHGFENGVDDYIVKPFSPKELMLRINAILKRVDNKKYFSRNNIQTFEGLCVDLSARTVTDRKSVV